MKANRQMRHCQHFYKYYLYVKLLYLQISQGSTHFDEPYFILNCAPEREILGSYNFVGCASKFNIIEPYRHPNHKP